MKSHWEVLFFAAVYAAGMSAGQVSEELHVLSLTDLSERAEIQRNQFIRMTPGEGPSLQELGWQWFDESTFSPAFLGHLVAVRKLGMWTWPLRAKLDPISLETIFFNGDGDEAGRVRTDFAKAESARMSLWVPLVAEKDVQDFAFRETWSACGSRVDEGEGGQVPTNLAFVSIFQTNKVVVLQLTNAAGTAELFEYSMKHEPHVATNVWTNDENFVVTNVATVWSNTSPSLCGFTNDWRILARADADPVARTVRFVDTTMATHDKIRFYAAAPIADSDGDGLTDGFETFCSHTDSMDAHSLFPEIQDNLATNPTTGRTWRDETLSIGALVTLTSTKAGWQMGESVGLGGSITQSFENICGQAIWLRIREGGYTPEAFQVDITGAEVAWSNLMRLDNHAVLDMVLVPRPTNACEVAVHDPGFVYTNIWRTNSLGADITLESEIFTPLLGNGDGCYVLNHNIYSFEYISGIPEMPELHAELSCKRVPIPEIGWQCTISYTRTNRWDFDTYPANSWHECLPDDEWDLAETMGDDIRGGRLELRTRLGMSVLTNELQIRGENPIDSDVEVLFADAPWYALPIAQHECGYSVQNGYRQFNTSGTLGTNIQGVASNDYFACPNRSSDMIGWGIMQLTLPVPSAQQLWDWRANVAGGLGHLQGDCRNEASAWLNSQIAQQELEEPLKPLSAEVFSIAGVAIRTAGDKTPLDICTIQRYNGTRGGWLIYWQNKTPQTEGRWCVRENCDGYAYVSSVLARLGDAE